MKEERLKHVADIRVSNVDKKITKGDARVRLCNYTDVYYNERIVGDFEFMIATATQGQRRTFGLRRGDVVLTKDSETADDIGVTALVTEDVPDLVCGYHLAIVRANTSRVVGGYLRWVLASQPARQRMSAAATGVTRFGLRSEAIADLPIPVPLLPAQHAIADYLDRETARIDALIAAKRRMVELLEERLPVAFDCAIRQQGFEFPVDLDPDWTQCPRPKDWAIMNLSQVLTQLTNGFVGATRDILVDDGVPYIQSLHIKNGRIDFAKRPFYVNEKWHAERPRIHLRQDDVLIVQTGDIGQVAVVPPAFGPASCHALQIARVKKAVITGRYLAAFLRSPFGRHSLLSRATGALHPHLEAGIKDIPVVVPPLYVQDVVVREVDQVEQCTASSISALDRQTDLLEERRQALITAAVTGQLDIPEAA